MIEMLNSGLRVLFGAVLYPFRSLNPLAALVVVSFLTAVVMLCVYRLTSKPERIREAKDKIMAHLLEMRLYKDSLPVTLRAQGMILRHNLKYLGHSARPLMVMIIPLILSIIQLDQWFGREPLKSGESAIVKVRFKDGSRPSAEAVVVEPRPGFAIDTPALRIAQEHETDWRIRATQPGRWELVLKTGSETVSKELVVGGLPLESVSPARVARNWIEQLANPGEPAIANDSAVKMIEVGYPAARFTLFGWRIHWLAIYLVLSIIFGFMLKNRFRVEF
jgi:uncharacterized membrane protein (DUF106 family)